MIFNRMLLCGLIAVILTSSLTAACIPNYECPEWNECVNGFQTRKCVETACNLEPLVERKLCGENDAECKVKYSCSDWSPCTYLGKTEDILNNRINYNGFQERTCVDSNNCVEGFGEQRNCEDVFKVNFVQVEQCGIPFLVALDEDSKREVSQINLASWQSQKLDIAFIQNNFTYCPSCYNGYRDAGEENIDCGGLCKDCNLEKGLSEQVFFIGSSWVTSSLILFAFIYSAFFNRRTRMRYLIYKAYRAIDNKDKASLKAIVGKIRSTNRLLNEEQKAHFRKDLERLYRRI